MYQDHEVIRVADDPLRRPSLGTPVNAFAAGGHRPAWPPWLHHMLIEHRHRHVEDQRGKDAALRRSSPGVLTLAKFGENPGLEKRLDQCQNAFVFDPQTYPLHKSGV